MATQQQPAFPAAPMVVPPGFRWSPEDVTRQQTRSTFLRVGPIQRTRQGTNANSKPVRALSGAVGKSWSSADPAEQSVIFNIEKRITGTPENVRLALQYAGISDAEINRVIAQSINAQNYQTTQAQAYQREIEAHKAKGRNTPLQQGYQIPEIIWFAENIKAATVVNSRSGDAAGRAGGAARGGARSLLGAYQLVAQGTQGKVIDVTNIDDVTGVGYKTKPMPKTTAGGFGAGAIPIVSQNFDKYVRALELIFGPEARQQFPGEIEQVRLSMQARPVFAGQPAAQGQPRFPGFPQQQPAQQGGFPAPPQQGGFPAPRPGATMAQAPVLRATGAPVPNVNSPVRTMGAGPAGMAPFGQVRQ